MKKHTCLLLWFIVITSVILAFTACNSNPATDGGSTEPSGSQLQMPVEKETGKERLLELGADDPSRSLMTVFNIIVLCFYSPKMNFS